MSYSMSYHIIYVVSLPSSLKITNISILSLPLSHSHFFSLTHTYMYMYNRQMHIFSFFQSFYLPFRFCLFLFRRCSRLLHHTMYYVCICIKIMRNLNALSFIRNLWFITVCASDSRFNYKKLKDSNKGEFH